MRGLIEAVEDKLRMSDIQRDALKTDIAHMGDKLKKLQLDNKSTKLKVTTALTSFTSTTEEIKAKMEKYEH